MTYTVGDYQMSERHGSALVTVDDKTCAVYYYPVLRHGVHHHHGELTTLLGKGVQDKCAFEITLLHICDNRWYLDGIARRGNHVSVLTVVEAEVIGKAILGYSGKRTKVEFVPLTARLVWPAGQPLDSYYELTIV